MSTRELARFLPHGLLLLAVFSACGGAEKGKTPSGVQASCAVDADCVVSDMSDCCARCRDAPHAVPKLDYERQERRCAVIDCTPESGPLECPKVDAKEGYVATCRAGICAAAKR